MKIEKLDPNFAKKEAGDDLLWYDLRALGVEGRGWTDTESFYDRLPARAKALVRGPVWELGQNSAGMFVRFVADTNSIAASWKLRFNSLAMPHMSALGMSGLDLYVEDKGRWRWIGIAQPAAFPSNRVSMVTIPRKRRHFCLYLPLYNGVESVSIGIPPDATIAKAPSPPKSRKPIAIYGTSIVQGGCASRPGLAYSSIIGRRLGRAFINLGFSGNGPMELEIARLLTELDVAAYVLDCVPNMTEKDVPERTEPFVRILREARPKTPIILVESITWQNALPGGKAPDYARKNRDYRAAFLRLKKAGVKGLHYVPGGNLLGHDWEGTVDSVHPNDIGFMRMADVLTAVIRRIL